MNNEPDYDNLYFEEKKMKKHQNIVELKYKWIVGRLTLGFVKDAIRNFCFYNGLSFEIIESYGFLSKPLYITIYTPENRIGYVRDYMESKEFRDE